MATEGQRLVRDYAIPPGETLLESIDSLGMTQAELSRRMGRPLKTINEIIKGKAMITADTALQLERVLGAPARFWLNLEANYREDLARLEEMRKLEREIEWLREIPCREMEEYGWLDTSGDSSDAGKLDAVLRYFGVASVGSWVETWKSPGAIYRKSSLFQAAPGPVAAWLRRGEIVAARTTCQAYDQKRFQTAVNLARTLTIEPPEVFVPRLQSVCAASGVVVAFVRELNKCPVSGATRWLTPSKALIQLSLRYKTDDQLWFTFFHEAGHILLHNKKLAFLESSEMTGATEEKLDQEADQFAENTLIPQLKWCEFVSGGSLNMSGVVGFSRSLGIAPGIVVGRLQHERLIPFNRFFSLKRKLKWA